MTDEETWGPSPCPRKAHTNRASTNVLFLEGLNGRTNKRGNLGPLPTQGTATACMRLLSCSPGAHIVRSQIINTRWRRRYGHRGQGFFCLPPIVKGGICTISCAQGQKVGEWKAMTPVCHLSDQVGGYTVQNGKHYAGHLR